MKIIDGKLLANNILEQEKAKIDKHKIKAKLGIICYGKNPASKVYINKKVQAGKKIGVEVEVFNFESTKNFCIEDKIQQLNNDKSFNGIIVQLPMPNTDASHYLEMIYTEKDVDGLNPLSLGKLFSNQPQTLISATPLAIDFILKHINQFQKFDKKVLIINRSILLGKPLLALLLNQDYTVTIAHSKTSNLSELIANNSIVISATGVANLVKKQNVQANSILIDAGFSKSKNGLIYGDIEKEAYKKASWVSPVPGGVGPIGVAMLLKNTVQAFFNQSAKS